MIMFALKGIKTRGLTCDGSGSESLLCIFMPVATGGNCCFGRLRCFAHEKRPQVSFYRLEPVFGGGFGGFGGFAMRESIKGVAEFPVTLPRCHHGTSPFVKEETA